MVASFVHDIQPQRVVFAAGAVERVGDEAARLGLHRALVIATPGGGARLGGQLVEILGTRAAGLHARAVVHVPKAVAEAGIAAARARPTAWSRPAAAPPSGWPRSSRATSACRFSRCRPPIPDRRRRRSGG
jgi:hypothetical protein